MLMSGQSESTSAINKRIIKTGGVRVLGKAAPNPQIHIVHNATVIQQQKMPSDTSSSNVNSDSTQVNKIIDNEKSNQDIENLHKENSEDLKRDDAGKEAEKVAEKETVKDVDKEDEKETNKEDGKLQRTAQPKKEPRRKRHHILPSEVKPVSREPSASALSKASQPPAEKPIPVPRTAKTVSKEKEEEEDIDNVNTTAEVDAHDEVCTTPSSGTRSPDNMEVS